MQIFSYLCKSCQEGLIEIILTLLLGQFQEGLGISIIPWRRHPLMLSHEFMESLEGDVNLAWMVEFAVIEEDEVLKGTLLGVRESAELDGFGHFDLRGYSPANVGGARACVTNTEGIGTKNGNSTWFTVIELRHALNLLV